MGSTSNIGYLLQHLSAVLAKQSDQALQERLGIGFSQYRILMVLEDHPDTQQRQIADKLGQTEASISRQIRIMQDKSLLQTTISPKNRREHLTSISPKGVRMAEEALNVLNACHAPTFDYLGAKQQAQLLDALASMHKHTCQPGKTGACDQPFSS